MKNNKWIKWLTGVSGAVLFTGLVGYMSSDQHGAVTTAAVTDDSAAASNGGNDQGYRDDVASEWQNETGMQGRRFGRGEPGMSAPDGSTGDNQLRTHAS